METQYSEINQNEILSENKKRAISAGKTNDILFVITPGVVGDRYSKGNIEDLKPLLSQLLVSKEDLQNIQL